MNGQKKYNIVPGLILAALAAVSAYALLGQGPREKPQAMSEEAFKKEMDQQTTVDIIGTNITLHQVIYGEGGRSWRYKLSTDCPYWDYEDRYVSKEPLAMADGENAAVETEAAEITVRVDGTEYARLQHFYVPLLDLYSNDETLEECEGRARAVAYEKYQEEIQDNGRKVARMTGTARTMAKGFLAFCAGYAVYLAGVIIQRQKKLGKKTLAVPKGEGVSLLVAENPSWRSRPVAIAVLTKYAEEAWKCIHTAQGQLSSKRAHFEDILESLLAEADIPSAVIGGMDLECLDICDTQGIHMDGVFMDINRQ